MAETLSERYTFANQTLNTKNIAFKSGTQASLKTLIDDGGATEGTFYLTTDTHRLYIGRAITAIKTGSTTTSVTKTIPIPVNEGISTVTNLSDLNNISANQGEFYYIENDNILAVRSGNTWVQLNPDTNDNDIIKVTGFTINGGTISNGNITYTYTLTQQRYDKNGSVVNDPNLQGTITSTFTVPASSIAGLVSVGVTSGAANSTTGVVDVSLTGSNADSTHKIALSGANGISLSTSTADNVVISGRTYSIGSPAVANSSNATSAAITLTDSDSGSSSVTVNTGANLGIDNTSAGSFIIKHTGAGTATGGTFGDNQTSVASGQAIKVPKITKDANGHIASISDVAVSIPVAVNNQSVTANNQGIITVTESNSDSVSSGQVLYHKITVDGTENTIYNQNSLGSFYSASQTDSLIEQAFQDMNAMVYKGTVGNSSSTLGNGDLPDGSANERVSIGDTYAVNATDQTINIDSNTSRTCQPGDLFIATSSDGTETNGYIPANKLVWTYIPAGNIDTQYKVVYSTDGSGTYYTLQTSGGSTPTGSSQIKLLSGTDITVSGNNSTNSATFNHQTSGVLSGNATVGYFGTPASVDNDTKFNTELSGTTLSYNSTFTVPIFKVNDRGHITKAGTKTYTLPASETFTLVQPSSLTSNKAIVELQNGSSTTVGSVAFRAGNDGLTIGVDSNGISYSHATPTITTPTAPSSASTIDSNGITVVTGITRDTYGHVTNYTLNKYSIPAAKTYSLHKETFSNNKMQFSVKDSDNSTMGKEIAITSDTLTLAETTPSSGTGAGVVYTYNVNLTWGSF